MTSLVSNTNLLIMFLTIYLFLPEILEKTLLKMLILALHFYQNRTTTFTDMSGCDLKMTGSLRVWSLTYSMRKKRTDTNKASICLESWHLHRSVFQNSNKKSHVEQNNEEFQNETLHWTGVFDLSVSWWWSMKRCVSTWTVERPRGPPSIGGQKDSPSRTIQAFLYRMREARGWTSSW